ncbi:hypothetical protein CAEBREN_04768 [Caenorhabditis brenneri]|uniref:Uncharacterized protein n=1 Tax=Caenorhabditis brenneri TaxID=135651 RepID=G0N543_CAEBE|nr:hypothetical protein CAEBREN_04768 [Caenorhabditis brenneri]
MCSLSFHVLILATFVVYGTFGMVRNETCNNSADCLEGLVCEKQICMDAPPMTLKRHPRAFHDRPKALCVLPLVCFP